MEIQIQLVREPSEQEAESLEELFHDYNPFLFNIGNEVFIQLHNLGIDNDNTP